MRFCFLALIFWASQAWALDFESLSTSMYCARAEACLPQESTFMAHLQLSCELETQSLKCADLEKENPDIAGKLRKCDEASICRELKEYTFEKNQACMRGYKNALFDMAVDIKDMAFSLAGLVEQTWEQTKADQKQRREFLQQCEISIVCKRDLVKDDQRYNKLSDHDLESYTATFLFTEAQELKAYKSSLARSRIPPYVPISERAKDDTQLSAEQAVKRNDLAKIIKEKIKKEYNKYQCFNPIAQEELECYVMGNIIDPTMVAGYFLKGARAASLARKAALLEKGGVEVREGTAVGKAINARAASREAFIGKYVSYSPTSSEQNARWIALAEKGPNSKMKFLDVENSQMKSLNDTLKNKNLVTSLTNYHKDLLFKHIDELEKEFPGLKIEKYSDFKSSRFAFAGEIPKDIEKRMQDIFKKTNDEFSDYLKSQDIVRATDPTESWFRAGWGGSADQANLSARYSRTQTDNVLQNFDSGELQTGLNAKISNIESQRQTLSKDLANTSVMREGTLDEDAFDIVRKGNGDLAKIREGLKDRFALSEISDATVDRITKYSREVDEFSPGIFIENREFASLDSAVHGGLSADMIGLGAANQRGTAEALARSSSLETTAKGISSSSLERALVEARDSEKIVTREFLQQKRVFEKTLNETLPRKVETVCSGDDCVGVLTGRISKAEKNKVVTELAKTRFAGKYRLAFIGDNVKDPLARNALATNGESIEKNLRTSLRRIIEPRKLKGLTFAADMQTSQLGRGPVDLIIGTAPGVTLTKAEKKLIEENFKGALIDLNNSLGKDGPKGAYTPVSLGGW
jgi:hypothetical protein